MDFEKRTATSKWLSESESSTNLSIILRVSMKYADCNNKKHTKHQLIELYKVCYEMAYSLKDHVTEKTVCNRLGLLCYHISRFNDALDYHAKHLRISKEIGHLTGEGNAYCNIGTVYRSLGQYEKAIEYYMKCLPIFKETGNRVEEGKDYWNIGNVYDSLGQYEKAMEYYMKCLPIFKETGNRVGEGKAYCNVGIVYDSLGQYEKAMEYYMKCLPIFKETGNRVGEGNTYCNIGVVYDSLGQNEKAMEYYMKCLPIYKETGDRVGEGSIYCNIGIVYHSLGQNEKAMEYFMKCLPIFKETGNRVEEGNTYCNIGNVCLLLGQYEKAMKLYYMKCLPIFKETGNRVGEGKAYGNIGSVCLLLGQYEKAMKLYYMKCLPIFKETGNRVGEGNTYCNIGDAHHSLGQYEKAMEYYMKCLPISKETGDRVGEGSICCNIGIVHHSLGQNEKAMEYFMKCLPIFKETGDRVGEGCIYCNIGIVNHLLGQREKPMEYYMKALPIFKETGNLRLEGFCYYGIGQVCFNNNDINRAEVNLKESLRCFQEIFKLIQYQDDYKVSIVDTYIKVYHLLTHVLIASGKEEEALLVSERSRSQALRDKLIMLYGGLPNGEEISETHNEDINSLITSSDSSFLFFSFCCRVLIFLIEQGKELCLRERSRGSFAFCANSDCSSTEFRKVVELYINKILKDGSQHVQKKRNYSCEDRSMNQDQDEYPDQQLPLDDSIFADDVERVTTTKEESLEDHVTTCAANYSRAPTDQSDQDSPISEQPSNQAQPSQPVFDATAPESKHEMHSDLPLPSNTKFPREEDGAFSRGKNSSDQRAADQNGDKAFEHLYEALIAPVEEALTKPEIVVIPDGPLFFVPFAALKDKSGRFLSETKRIRLIPSLTILKILKECPAERHCKKGALIVGGPKFGTVMYKDKETEFDDLKFARREARMIGKILGEKALTGHLATKDEVKRRLQEGVAIIHFATHCNGTTGEVLFAPGSSVKGIAKEEDYMLTARDIYSSGINAQLVVLSCCQSGRGKIGAEGVVGLTRAFLAAGARSVVASLWAVDDLITLYFMESFYQHLKSGESASASLQQAMERIRKIPLWSHPYYWAPFFIVGDDVRITT